MGKKDRKDEVPGTVFKVGGIAFAFLIIGYQSALFVHRAAALYIAAHRDAPDTVYVVDEALAARLLEGAAEAGGQRESIAPSGQSGGAREAAHAAGRKLHFQPQHRERRGSYAPGVQRETGSVYR